MGTYRTFKDRHGTNYKWCISYQTRTWSCIVEQFDKRNDARDYAKKCNNKEPDCGITYVLRWFAADTTDALVGEAVLPFTPEEVHKLMELDPYEAPLDCYTVTASQRQVLQKLVKHKINLNKYCYDVETA